VSYFPNSKIYSCLLKAERPLKFCKNLKTEGMVCYSRTVLTSAAQLSDGSEVNISTRISSLERTFCTISTVGFWFGLVGFFCCCFQEIYPVQLSYVPKIPRCRCWLGSQDLLLGAKAFSLYCVKVERGRKGLFCALGCVEFFIGYY